MSDDRLLSSDSIADVATLWQMLCPSSCGDEPSKPRGRCGHIAASTTSGLVILGGYNAQGIISLSDVWEFALETRQWSKLDLGGGAGPPDRAYFKGCEGPPLLDSPDYAVEAEGPFVYVFGGTDVEGRASNDLWCLDVKSRSWRRSQPGSRESQDQVGAPCARSNHAMCRLNNTLAVHGGDSSSGASLADLWLFQPATSLWRQACTSPSGPHPCARSSHCLAFAEHCSGEQPTGSGSMVLFGGLGRDGEDGDEEEAVPMNDLWVLRSVDRELGDALWYEEARDCKLDEDQHPASPPVWSKVLLDGVGPSPRSLAALVPSPRGKGVEFFLFGGYGLVELPVDDSDGLEREETSLDIVAAYIDDLWKLSLEGAGAWVDEEEMGFPGESIVEGRNGHTLTCARDKLVLFGGFVGDNFDSSVHVADIPPSSRAADTLDRR